MIKKEKLFQIFFTIAFIGLLYETFILLQPLFTPLLLAIILWLLAMPMDHYFGRRWPLLTASKRALLSTVTVLLIFVIPMTLLLWLFISEFQDLIPQLQMSFTQAKNWLQNPPIQHWPGIYQLETWHRHLPWIPRPDLKNRLETWGAAVLSGLTTMGSTLAASTAMFLFYLVIILLALFFLFSDGRRWYEMGMELIPMRPDQKRRIVHTFKEAITNIVRGSIITSLFQTVTAIIGYWIVGMDAGITLGLLTGIASFIPVVGSAVVWLLVAGYWMVQGVWWKAIFMLFWGTVLIAMTDNVIRTYFIGKSDEMPLFFMFLGLIGGAAVYGAAGLLIGPLVVAIMPVFIDIYKEMYLHQDHE